MVNMKGSRYITLIVDVFLIFLFALPMAGAYFKLTIPILSSLINYFQFIFAFLILVYHYTHKRLAEPTTNLLRALVLIFIIYYLFALDDIYLSPRMSRDIMDGVHSDFTTITRIGIILISFLCVGTIKRFANFERVAKFTCVLMTVFLLLYFTVVDYTLYLAMASPMYNIRELLEEVPVNPSQVGQYAGLSIITCLLVYNKWSKFNIINTLISFAIIVIDIILLFISLRRGISLYVIMIALFWLYVNKVISLKNVGILALILAVITLVLVNYGSFFSDISEGLLSRFENDSTGSGRYGDDSSIYSIAIQQIGEHPFFGSYFRLLTGADRGSYAHNFFLETLMTFGFVFSIPLYIIIFKAVFRSITAYVNKKDFGYMLFVFIFFFLSLMTSGTIFANYWFWIPLAYLCNESKRKRNRVKNVAAVSFSNT